MILSEMKLTQQKALAGLDNVSAAGIAAIDKMVNIVKNKLTEINSQERSNLLKRINELGKYIKLEYKINCSKPCHLVSSHCPCWGISDPDKEHLSVDCEGIHEKSFTQCENILEVFIIFKDYAAKEKHDEQQADIFYDISWKMT